MPRLHPAQAAHLPLPVTGVCAQRVDPAWLKERIGTMIGRSHRVMRHIASGGMGHVFVVEHVSLGAYAAAKLAHPHSEKARETLAHEAKLLSRVQHPHIVQVFDYGQTVDECDYMLMEYVGGVELHAFIESGGPMSLERALPILRQLGSALDHLHAHGIVHSDVKPANVLFDPCAGDFAKLIDFGVAFYEATHGQGRDSCGTPAYMAPEQTPGHPCERSIDVYGLAALAFELVTGRLIREYETRETALRAALDLMPSLEQRGALAGFHTILERALDDRPTARFQSAGAFVCALDQALHKYARISPRFR